MTADEVKDAHDRIWAVREKIELGSIFVQKDVKTKTWSISITGVSTINLVIKGRFSYVFTITSEVNQFLKELG